MLTSYDPQQGGPYNSFGRVVYHVRPRGIIVGSILMTRSNELDHSLTYVSNSWCFEGACNYLQIVKGDISFNVVVYHDEMK